MEKKRLQIPNPENFFSTLILSSSLFKYKFVSTMLFSGVLWEYRREARSCATSLNPHPVSTLSRLWTIHHQLSGMYPHARLETTKKSHSWKPYNIIKEKCFSFWQLHLTVLFLYFNYAPSNTFHIHINHIYLKGPMKSNFPYFPKHIWLF